MRRLPLGPIEAFVTVARSRSLAQAALAMNLTVPALSRRIRLLEAYVGKSLFRRLPRGLDLTVDGAAYFASLSPAWDAVRDATEIACGRARRDRLKVSVMPSFASNWLMPRLTRFHARHPAPTIELETSPELAELAARPDLDCVIRLGMGPWTGLRGDAFLPVHAFPVASPDLVDTMSAPRQPSDLLGQLLIGTQHQPEFWHEWFAAAGLNARAGRHRSFDNLQVAYEAAAAGMGIALGLAPVVQPFLESRRLCRLLPGTVRMSRQFHLLWPADREPDRRFWLFRDWLLDEAARAGSESPAA